MTLASNFRILSICIAASVWVPCALAQTNAAPADAMPAAAKPAAGLAASDLAASAPERYTIKPGDTLWGLSSLYLKSPWRWPELWRMNQAQVRNPHLIYPGQVMVLSLDANGRPRLSLDGTQTSGVVTGEGGPRPTVKISPQLRYEAISRDLAVPSIPPAELEPFLSRPLVIDPDALDKNPTIVVTDDRRVVLAKGDVAYVVSIKEGQGRDWQVYRAAGALRDPRWVPTPWWKSDYWYTGKWEKDAGLLGYEATYLGDARVLQYGDVAKVEVIAAKEEIVPTDKLIVSPPPENISYVPRAPEKPVDSVVIKLNGPLADAGRGSVVSLASGAADGLEIGHVVQFIRPARSVPNPRWVRPALWQPGWFDPNPSKEPEFLKLPEERIGLGFVFRTFEKVAYCYIVSTSAMVRVGDLVRNP